MATILVIGDAAELAPALEARGHAVRALPEPENLGGILPELQGVSALAWLGGPELLESLAAKLVDTHVRGFACGPAGAEIAARFTETYGMPTAVIEGGTGDAVRAVESLIA
ncbi:MAG TPA: hypothetical protein VF715_08635 [Thermoleophilaceae bacterium]